jgi:WhiB family redox-sensing transcriptional regulator
MTPIHPETDTSWLLQAACKGLDVNLFFPGRGDTRGLHAAQKICASCPSRQPCLQYALDQPFTLQGIFGGASERERRRIRLRNNKQQRLIEMQGRA